MIDMKLFKDPPSEYRGTDLWMMNTALDEESISMQLDEMKKAGIGSFIARTYNGHQSDYPGEQYHKAMEFVIKKSAELGLNVYLQAGYMPSGMPDIPEDYKLRVLLRSPEKDYNGEGTVLKITDGNVYYLQAANSMFDILSKKAIGYYVDIAYEQMWSCFKNEFGKSVTSIWVDEPYLNPNNVSWSSELPEKFSQMWGYDITDKLSELFDENGRHEKVRYHFYRCIADMMDEAYFTAISDWCHSNGLSFSGHLMGEDTLWYQTVFGASVMRHYKYFDIPGIDFLTGSLYWYHGVGNDKNNKSLLFVTNPLQCSSAAHQAGKNEVLAEMYGVSSQDLGTDRQREIFDHLAVLGVNRKCIHAMFSSLKGQRKYLYVPNIFYQQPYWNDYKLFTDYQARVSMFMREGKPEKDILLIHPAEDFYMNFNPKSRPSVELFTQNSGIEREFNTLLCNLLGGHQQFDLGDEQTIEMSGSAKDCRFTVGEMSYSTVVVPSMTTLRRNTAELLLNHCGNGGKVIIFGKRPHMLDASADESGLLELLYGSDNCSFAEGYAELSEELEKNVDPDVKCVGPDNPSVWLNIRRTCGGFNIFIFNKGSRNEKVTLRFKGKCSVKSLNAETGCEDPVFYYAVSDKTIAIPEVPAGRSVMISSAQYSGESKYIPLKLNSLISIDDDWKLTGTDSPNTYLLEYCAYRLESSVEWSKEYPQIAIRRMLRNTAYNGSFSLKYRFDVKELPSDDSTALMLEQLNEYKAVLNGIDLNTSNPDGYYFESSFKYVKLGNALKSGRNELIFSGVYKQPSSNVPHLFALFRSTGGTELANPYITGNFKINVHRTYSHTDMIRISPDYEITNQADCDIHNIVAGGYPFYAGSLTFEREVLIEEIPQNGVWKLSIGEFSGCIAKVSINGSPDIPMIFKPYETDITTYIKSGANKLKLTLTNTLYNMLGPWHTPSGERDTTWGDACWTGDAPNTGYELWFRDKYSDTASWISDFHLKPYGMSDITLKYYK